MSDLVDLHRRITMLEDVEAIKRLKSRYLSAIDDEQLDTALDCFTQSGVAQFGHLGAYEGREGITRFLKGLWSGRVLSIHQSHDHEVEITGDNTARGKQKIQVMSTKKVDGTDQAYWAASAHEDEYVKVDGAWKMQRNWINIIFLSKYEKGWGKERVS